MANLRVNEILDMSLIIRKHLFMKLPAVEEKHKQLNAHVRHR